MKVIVTDARYRMSLPIIRSLGRVGAHIVCAETAGTPRKSALGFHSKYTSETVYLPSTDEGWRYMTALEELSLDGKNVLIPVGMDTLTFLSQHREWAEERFHIAIPSFDALTLANDKYAVINKAAELGVPHPETTALANGETVENLSLRVKYPAVIKYRAGELLHLDPKDRYAIVKTPDELINRYTAMSDRQAKPLVQEYVSGEGFGVSVVMDKLGNPMTVFCHRRLHEYPVSGGPSCLCESAWDGELAMYAVKLLRSISFVGPAMVEFKGSTERGYKLMEINPRLWGSSALAPIAGCDIGSAIVKAAMGEFADSGELTCKYKLSRRMRFRLQDTLAFPAYVKASEKKLVSAIKYIGTIFDLRTKDGVFSFSDPIPGVKYLALALKKKDKIIR